MQWPNSLRLRGSQNNAPPEMIDLPDVSQQPTADSVGNKKRPLQNIESTNSSNTDPKPPSDFRDAEANTNEPAADYSGAVEKTDPLEIKLVRMIDRRMMPMLMFMYLLNYIDRTAIASAKLDNIQGDLDIDSQQYQNSIMILFIPYIVCQIPSNFIIAGNWISPRVYMSVAMGAWAIISLCTAFVKNYPGLLTVRFLLGTTEAPFFPGALFLMSSFYTRKELAVRVAICYSGNILAQTIAGPLALAVFNNLGGKLGLKGWQWLFIIEGAVTVVAAIVSYIALPNKIQDTYWLSPGQKKLADGRIRKDTVKEEEETSVCASFKNIGADPIVYLFMLMQFFHLCACGFTNFYPSIMLSVSGGDKNKALAYGAGPFAFALFVVWGVGYSSGKFNERRWHITITMSMALIGFIGLAIIDNPSGRYFCCFLITGGSYGVNSVILGWVSATLGQTPGKKAAALAMINMAGNASYLVTPHLYRDSDGPKYTIAMIANSVFIVACLACVWAMVFLLKKRNREMNANPDEQVNRARYAI